MANSPSVVDFNATLSEFEATAVSDGTFADVLQTAKVDAVAAPASVIANYGGELWANMVDDYVRATWPYMYGRAQVGTTEATVATGTPTNVRDLSAPTADTALHFEARIYGKDPADAANVYLQKLEVLLVNDAGTLSVIVISAADYTGGTWTVTPAHLISGTNYALRFTHNAAGNAYFDVQIDNSRALRGAP